MKKGRCECGGVRFQSIGPWRDVIACHCETCRRTSGHFWAASAVPEETLELTSSDTLVWFNSSNTAKRAFCNRCGASLFYKHIDKSYIAVGAGTLDAPTGLRMVEEVFTHEKGDYYALTEGMKHHEDWSEAWKATNNIEAKS